MAQLWNDLLELIIAEDWNKKCLEPLPHDDLMGMLREGRQVWGGETLIPLPSSTRTKSVKVTA
jgi:hypothetical protein